MIIRNMSSLSGNTNEFDIDVTARQISAWLEGELIQDAMPELEDWEREFIKTGITPDEWVKVFGADDDTEEEYNDDDDEYFYHEFSRSTL